MTDILLFNPSTSDLNPKPIGRMPPLGLSYLNSYIKQKGYSSEVVDCIGENISHLDASRLVREKKPEFVGITTTTILLEYAIDLAKIIKTNNPSVIIIMGGCHVTALGDDVLRECDAIDLIVRGEGEITLYEILQEYKKNRPDLKTVKGISYRSNGIIYRNESRELIKDIDTIPFPSRELIGNKNYQLSVKWFYRSPYATMITSRGCPYPCEFCDVKNMFGQKIRYRTIANVIKEIKTLSKEYGVKEIIFYDDIFTLKEKRVVEFCQKLISENLDITWGCFSRVDTINDEMAFLMKKAGCHMISLGIESGSDEVLKSMKKGTNTNQARKTLLTLRKNKIETSASFVVGFPGETRESIKKTIRFAKEINTTFAAFFRLIPYPGTPLYSLYLKQDKLEKLYISQFKELGSKRVIQLKMISENELGRIIRNMFIAFYFRPKKLLEHVLRIMSIHRFKGYLNSFLWFFVQKRKI